MNTIHPEENLTEEDYKRIIYTMTVGHKRKWSNVKVILLLVAVGVLIAFTCIRLLSFGLVK